MKLSELQQLFSAATMMYGDLDIEAIKLGSFDIPQFQFITASVNITTNGNAILEFYQMPF